MNGIGDKQRPTDKAKFDDNLNRIFGNAFKPEIEQDEYDLVRASWIRASWRPTAELPFTWGDKTYKQMHNTLTGEYCYYNVTDQNYEPHVEFKL